MMNIIGNAELIKVVPTKRRIEMTVSGSDDVGRIVVTKKAALEFLKCYDIGLEGWVPEEDPTTLVIDRAMD